MTQGHGRRLNHRRWFEVAVEFPAAGRPVIFLLQDGDSGLVDASLVMLTDEDKAKNHWQRATFCEVCFNQFKEGVYWFETQFDHPKEKSVYSACEACLAEVDCSTLPELSWSV